MSNLIVTFKEMDDTESVLTVDHMTIVTVKNGNVLSIGTDYTFHVKEAVILDQTTNFVKQFDITLPTDEVPETGIERQGRYSHKIPDNSLVSIRDGAFYYDANGTNVYLGPTLLWNAIGTDLVVDENHFTSAPDGLILEETYWAEKWIELPEGDSTVYTLDEVHGLTNCLFGLDQIYVKRDHPSTFKRRSKVVGKEDMDLGPELCLPYVNGVTYYFKASNYANASVFKSMIEKWAGTSQLTFYFK